jgi:hypothetical protein
MRTHIFFNNSDKRFYCEKNNVSHSGGSVTFLAGWADILILPSTNVIIVITYYIFFYVCCNCWKGISVLVTANCSVQQEPTGRSRKSLAGKGIRKCYLLLWK